MDLSSKVELSPTDLKRLQEILTALLFEFDRICRKNNINYSLYAGTMLGAVRHHAIIPWDDDADVFMLRSEYEKFCTACKTDINSQSFFFQTVETDPGYRWGYGKLLMLNTEFVRIYQEHLPMKHCVFLDIFPLDGMPTTPTRKKIHHFCCYALQKISWSSVGKYCVQKAHLRAWYHVLSWIPIKMVYKGFTLLSKICNEENSTRVRIISRPYGVNRKGYPRSWFLDLEDIEFSGTMLKIIKKHHKMLTIMYTNRYMEYPPENKRNGTADVSSFRFAE